MTATLLTLVTSCSSHGTLPPRPTPEGGGAGGARAAYVVRNTDISVRRRGTSRELGTRGRAVRGWPPCTGTIVRSRGGPVIGRARDRRRPGRSERPGFVWFAAQDWWYHNQAHS